MEGLKIEVDGIVGKWGVDGVIGNGEHLAEICAEKRLLFPKPFFLHRMTQRYMWKRRGKRSAQKSMIK